MTIGDANITKFRIPGIGLDITSAVAPQLGNGCVTENSLTITSNYTMTSNKSGVSVGDITIASGATVTIPSGSRYVIL